MIKNLTKDNEDMRVLTEDSVNVRKKNNEIQMESNRVR